MLDTDFPAIVEIDQAILERCLQRRPRAWEDFVDRFMGLILHVVDHSSQARGIRLPVAVRETACEAVFKALARDDFHLLRRFEGRCSLATYLTVVSRRVIVRHLLERMVERPPCPDQVAMASERPDGDRHVAGRDMKDRPAGEVETPFSLKDADGIRRELHAAHASMVPPPHRDRVRGDAPPARR